MNLEHSKKLFLAMSKTIQNELLKVNTKSSPQEISNDLDIIRNLFEKLSMCDEICLSENGEVEIAKSLQAHELKLEETRIINQKYGELLYKLPSKLKFQFNENDFTPSNEDIAHLQLIGVKISNEEGEFSIANTEIIDLIKLNYDVVEVDASSNGEAYTSASEWSTRSSTLEELSKINLSIDQSMRHHFAFSEEEGHIEITMQKKSTLMDFENETNEKLTGINFLTRVDLSELKNNYAIPEELHLYYKEELDDGEIYIEDGLLYDSKRNQLKAYYSRSKIHLKNNLSWGKTLIIHDNINKRLPRFLSLVYRSRIRVHMDNIKWIHLPINVLVISNPNIDTSKIVGISNVSKIEVIHDRMRIE